MPSKIVNSLMAELKIVHDKMDAHLAEGVGVKADIAWLKKLIVMVLVGMISLWFKK